MSIIIQQGVLLLNTKPGVLLLGLLHHLQAGLAVVGVYWFFVVLLGVAHHHDVVSTSEWVGIDLHWVKVGVRV